MSVKHREFFHSLVIDATVAALDVPYAPEVGQKLADDIHAKAWPALPWKWRNRYTPVVRVLMNEGVGTYLIGVYDRTEGQVMTMQALLERLEAAPAVHLVN